MIAADFRAGEPAAAPAGAQAGRESIVAQRPAALGGTPITPTVVPPTPGTSATPPLGTETPSAPGAAPPALAVAAVARRLGVAPSTLRTWDRRYGLGPSEHSAGSHRRYTADDVARLLVMRQLTLEGVAPADAARSARETDPAGRPGAGGPPSSRRAPGGPGEFATPGLLVETAMRDDELGCRRLLSAATEDVESWWTSLVEPARASLAARTVLARAGEDAEWVLDSAALAVLRTRARPPAGAAAVGDRVVLLFAAPRERRPLALHVLAAALADRGVDARVVTGPVESHRVLELVAMTHPVAVAVLTEAAAPDFAVFAELHSAAQDLPLFVGLTEAAGRTDLPLARSIHRSRSFVGLLHEILAVSG